MTLRVEVPGEKVVNVEPCKCNKAYGTELVKTETKLSKRVKEFIKTSWAFRSKVTVEPFGRTHNYTEQERNVQFMVDWNDSVEFSPADGPPWYIGVICRRLERPHRTVFFMQIGMNETALIEGLPPALAGGRVAMSMAIYSYITDITSESERTFRLGIVTAVLTLARPVGLALSGYMTKRFGYYAIWWATLKVGFKSREGTRRLQIILIMFAYMFIVGPRSR
ncbi:hypothetical protein ACJJTC_003089 [Scirpophaga incertulas]